MQPSNGIIGDESGTELPQAPVDETALGELRAKAKYSRSKEYKELRAKAQERIDFYKTTLPAGYADADSQKKAEMWGFANLMVAEFEQLFSEHENAAELLKEIYDE